MSNELPEALQADIDLAIRLAQLGGGVASQWFTKSGIHADSKADGTPVTEADKAAEHAIREEIQRCDPDASVVGEEAPARQTASSRTWYIDPVDGTRAFSRGVPLFGCMIALHDEHGAAVGVIYLPELNELVVAGRGRGCTLNGERVFVSDHPSLNGAFLANNGFHGYPMALIEALLQAGVLGRGWGDGYSAPLVATGRAEAMIYWRGGLWDLAPMQVIMTEAGGRFSALDGSQRIDTGFGLLSNANIHDELLALVRETLEQGRIAGRKD